MPSSSRMALQTSCASPALATRPVPIAHTGSYAMTACADLLGGQPGQRPAQHLDVVLDVVTGLADLELLADADDRDEAVLERGGRLRGDQGVVLVVVRAALRVADDGVGAAQLR